MKHNILFTRNEGFKGITQAVHITFEADAKDGIKALSRAVIQWGMTQEGEEATAYGGDDFNIGDLASYVGDSHADIFEPYGIKDLKISGFTQEEHYDRILVA